MCLIVDVLVVGVFVEDVSYCRCISGQLVASGGLDNVCSVFTLSDREGKVTL